MGRGVVRPPLAAKSKERQSDYFKLKTDFVSSTDFQLLNQTEGNFVTFFFKCMISFKDSHCDYSPRAPKNVNYTTIFTFVLPCIVIDVFLNNQQDAPIIQIFCYKTLHVSAIPSAHHQEFCTVHSALVSFMQVF